MSSLILTSSFQAVAQELWEKRVLPHGPAKVIFIPNASDPYDQKPWMIADRKALVDLGYLVTDVDLKGKTSVQLQEEMKEASIIFVAGGNTTYLLECVHQSGADEVIHRLAERGCLYIGSSAGSILAGPSVEPFKQEEIPDLPKDFVLHDARGLHLVDYVILPHYPSYTVPNDRIAEAYADRFTFVKMRDDEYRVERR